jgi:cellulose synthase (UDP-forming)
VKLREGEFEKMAAWSRDLGPPGPEPANSRHWAHVGALASILALALYLSWRIVETLPSGRWNQAVAWTLIGFEALPLFGLVIKAILLWNIDSAPPVPVTDVALGRVAVLIPTYNEPVEVIAPTIAAACALEPAHETWVLDDSERPWVAEMCAAWGAR